MKRAGLATSPSASAKSYCGGVPKVQGPLNLSPHLRSLTLPRIVSVTVLSKHRKPSVVPLAPHPMAPPQSLVKFYWQPNRASCSLQLLLSRGNHSEGRRRLHPTITSAAANTSIVPAKCVRGSDASSVHL